MDNFDRQILRATLTELAGDIAAEVGSSQARTKLHMVSFLLAHMLKRAGVAPEHVSIEEEVVALRDAEEGEQRILSSQTILKQPEPAISAESLTLYVRTHLLEPQVVVTEVQRSFGGFSKQTFILKLSGAERFDNRLVLRLDQEGGPVESRVADEFSIIRSMYDCGVPVPEPLWMDRSPPFGGTCVMMRMVPGNTAYDVAGVRIGAEARSACLALARVLAMIHKISLSAINLPSGLATASLGEHVRQMILNYEDQWKRRRVNLSPTLHKAFEWLYANVPQESRASLVHGDASLRNLMVHEGKESAILDWELWHVGDHNEDLAYCRPDIEKFISWEEFLKEYLAYGGLPCQSRSIDYYAVFCAVRNAVFGEACLHSFVNAAVPEPKYAYGALVLGRQNIYLIADKIRSAG